MKPFTKVILFTLVSFLIMSLPFMLGFGYEIDWVNEATAIQKVTGHIVEGLTLHFTIKLLLSIVLGTIIVYSMYYRKKTS
ncbi:hypothetical protein LCL95_02005 [Bacillus timonensis]|nr:hypothetical protein [Bacillus timonensis]